MSAQVEVTKLTQHTLIGTPAGDVTVAKLVMYAVLEPGDGGGTVDIGARQGHVFVQIVEN